MVVHSKFMGEYPQQGEAITFDLMVYMVVSRSTREEDKGYEFGHYHCSLHAHPL